MLSSNNVYLTLDFCVCLPLFGLVLKARISGI